MLPSKKVVKLLIDQISSISRKIEKKKKQKVDRNRDGGVKKTKRRTPSTIEEEK